MEPIDDWMRDSMKNMDHAPPKASYEDPTWPTMAQTVEDTFMAPQSEAELYHSPVKPATKVELEAATQAFLSMATAEDRGLTDNVVLPEHYARFAIEPIRFIVENNLTFMQGNIIKYVLRWDAKNGMEDLQKAKRYLDMFIKFVGKDPDWWRK